jgi:hypothetical protein
MTEFDRWAKRAGFAYLNEDESPLPNFGGDPDMPDLSLCSFEYLAAELRKRGATVTAVPHGGDFSDQ